MNGVAYERDALKPRVLDILEPLYESSVFRREVPSEGEPRDAARWRVLRDVGRESMPFVRHAHN